LYGFTATAIGMIVGVLAVLRYFDTALNQQLSGPLTLLAPIYDDVIQGIAREARPYIEAILWRMNQWWNWRLELPPGWAYLFVPPWLYFMKVASANFAMPQRGRYVLGILVFVIGGVTSLAMCIAAGTTEASSIWRLLYPIACFTVFELALTLFVVVVDNGFPWRSKIRWQFWTHVPTTLAVGGLVLLLHFAWGHWGVEHLDVLLIMVLVALIGGRDIGIAAYATIAKRMPEQAPWDHFTSQGNYKLGRLVLGIAVGSVIYAMLFPATPN
jgi:hypothetical protein